MSIMSVSEYLCCCVSSSNRRGRRRHRRLHTVYDEAYDDYTMPSHTGVQWDRDTKSFIKKGYVPPNIPDSSTNSTSDSDAISIEHFELIKTLGKGAFGRVFLAAHVPPTAGRGSKALYAVKVIPKVKLNTAKHKQQIIAEIDILKKIKHPFCISLQFAFQSDAFLFYVMEFAAGGALLYHLREETRFSEARSRFYIGEIILALEYIHQLNIVFCDLKPENCMLSAIGHVIITDFGSAMKLQSGDTSTTISGTPQYMAPEVLSGGQYDSRADWWSCGVLLYEMLTGKTPFHSNNRVELYRAVLRGQFNIPFYISPRARSLLCRMISRDPVRRVGGAGIKTHPFFSRTLITPNEEIEYNSEDRESQSSAGNIVRRLSHSAAHFAGSSNRGTPCEWDWVDLMTCSVDPPFIPKLTHPTDCRYFDPVITAIPPNISDLTSFALTSSVAMTTSYALTSSAPSSTTIGNTTLEGFDYNRSLYNSISDSISSSDSSNVITAEIH